MEGFFTSGYIANVILVLIALEIAGAAWWFWRKGETLQIFSFAANGLAGASLVLALRAALQQAGWLFVAIYLLGGLLAHAADVALRLIAAGRAETPTSPD